MVDFKKLSDDCTVSGQLQESDVAAAARAGVRMIVCTRPDGEEPGQPDAEMVAGWASAHGIAFAHAPVTIAAGITGEAVAQMREALAAASGPVHAYCKAGGRAAALWALASAAEGRYGAAELLEKTRAAGFDLSGLAPALESLAGQAIGGLAGNPGG